MFFTHQYCRQKLKLTKGHHSDLQFNKFTTFVCAKCTNSTDHKKGRYQVLKTLVGRWASVATVIKASYFMLPYSESQVVDWYVCFFNEIDIMPQSIFDVCLVWLSSRVKAGILPVIATSAPVRLHGKGLVAFVRSLWVLAWNWVA